MKLKTDTLSMMCYCVAGASDSRECCRVVQRNAASSGTAGVAYERRAWDEPTLPQTLALKAWQCRSMCQITVVQCRQTQRDHFTAFVCPMSVKHVWRSAICAQCTHC